MNPTNSASVLALLPPAPANNTNGVTVTWQSVSGINYFIQRSSNLTAQPACQIQAKSGRLFLS